MEAAGITSVAVVPGEEELQERLGTESINYRETFSLCYVGFKVSMAKNERKRMKRVW